VGGAGGRDAGALCAADDPGRTRRGGRGCAGVAGLVLAGMWLERYLLVAPSMNPQPGCGLVTCWSRWALRGAGAGAGVVLRRYRPVFAETRYGVFVGEAAVFEAEGRRNDPPPVELGLGAGRAAGPARPRGWRWNSGAGAGRLAVRPQRVGPAQPLPFSHMVHAGYKGISCLFCHDSADRSRTRACRRWPSACCAMTRSSRTSRPSRRCISITTAETPVPWVRVYKLSDFVFFNHEMHIRKNVDCGACHGDVKAMDRIVLNQKLEMGWCVDCHRKPENKASVDWLDVSSVGGSAVGRGLVPRRLRPRQTKRREPPLRRTARHESAPYREPWTSSSTCSTWSFRGRSTLPRGGSS